MFSSAGYVWATSQQVFRRNTLQRVRSLGPLLTFFGGFPSDENGGKRPPWETQSPSDFPTLKDLKIVQCSILIRTIDDQKTKF